MTITITWQIKKGHLDIEQKREILQHREIFLQNSLNFVKANAWTRQWIYSMCYLYVCCMKTVGVKKRHFYVKKCHFTNIYQYCKNYFLTGPFFCTTCIFMVLITNEVKTALRFYPSIFRSHSVIFFRVPGREMFLRSFFFILFLYMCMSS